MRVIWKSKELGNKPAWCKCVGTAVAKCTLLETGLKFCYFTLLSTCCLCDGRATDCTAVFLHQFVSLTAGSTPSGDYHAFVWKTEVLAELKWLACMLLVHQHSRTNSCLHALVCGISAF